jgi:hypothetical protein
MEEVKVLEINNKKEARFSGRIRSNSTKQTVFIPPLQ